MIHMVRTSKGTKDFTVKMLLITLFSLPFALLRSNLLPTSGVSVIIYVHNICTGDMFNQFFINGQLVYFQYFASINDGTMNILAFYTCK